MNKPIEKLSLVEQHDLKKLEGIIQENKKFFLRFGSALEEIRDRRLYRAQHATFEEYCLKRWGFTSRKINYSIQSGVAVKQLPSDLRTIVPSEGAARELAKVSADKRVAVISAIKDKGKVATAAAIKAEAKKDKTIVMDKTGYAVPDKLVEFWLRAHEVQELLTAVQRIRGKLDQALTDKDLMYAEVNFNDAASCLSSLYANIKRAVPYSVCPQCQGRVEVIDKCTLCKGRGIISEFLFKTAVPAEIKDVRQKALSNK